MSSVMRDTMGYHFTATRMPRIAIIKGQKITNMKKKENLTLQIRMQNDSAANLQNNLAVS